PLFPDLPHASGCRPGRRRARARKNLARNPAKRAVLRAYHSRVTASHPVAFKPETVGFRPETAADAWLGLLAARGVEYLFANGGTDFAPVVEACAKGQALGWRLPEVVIVPHENLGVAMAHGYTMITGRPQAMMVHVGVGTANAVNGLMNASRMNIPILFSAGCTPLTESGALTAARNNYIHWA